MKENNMMSYEMYEDFKETMVKTIKTELAAKTANNNQSSDNDLSQRLEQIVYTEQERHQAIIIQLAGRLESIEQNYTKTQTGIDNLQASVEAIKIPAENNPTPSDFQLRIPIRHLFGAISFYKLHDFVVGTLFRYPTEPRPHRQRSEIPLYKDERRRDTRTHRRIGRAIRTKPRHPPENRTRRTDETERTGSRKT